MNPVIRSVFLLSLSLCTDAALKCYKCKAKNSDTCEQEVEECKEGDRCIIISEEFIGNGTYHSIAKGCTSSKGLPCDVVPYGKVSEELALKFSTKCCDGDLCNKEFYQMPEDSKLNGAKCPSCFEYNGMEECEAKHDIECRGDDVKCIKFVGTFKKPDDELVRYSSKGCTSNFVCNMDLAKLIGIQIQEAKVFKCEDAAAESSKG